MVYQILNSEWKFRGRAFDVRQDEVQLPNGTKTTLDIVVHAGAVTVLPVDSKGQIWFVRQYRHPAGMEILELPAGTLEDGEEPDACANREIQEEIGMAAGSLIKIGEFFMTPGYSTEFMHVYLAQDLVPSTLPADADEFLTVIKQPVQHVLDTARSGKILDSKSLAALILAQPYLKTIKS